MKMKFTGFEKIVLGTLLVISIPSVAVSFIDADVFENQIAVEDGPIETATVIGLLCCAALAVRRLATGIKSGRAKTYLAGLCLTFGVFMFGAIEEISWGQRIFNVESPEFFEANNSQQETNLHNFMIGDVSVNRLVFGKLLAVLIVGYVFALPWLWSKSPKLQTLLGQWAVPVPQLYLGVSYLGLILCIAPVQSPLRGELFEFCGSFVFFLMHLNPMNLSVFQNTDESSTEQDSTASDEYQAAA